MASGATCTSDSFTYLNASGKVAGFSQDGLCGVFPTAECGNLDLPLSNCCELSSDTNSNLSSAQGLMYICWAPLGLTIMLLIYFKKQREKETGKSDEFDPVRTWIESLNESNPLRGYLLWLWQLGFGAFLGLMIYASIALATSTQDSFSVADRNALGAAMAFLTPIESVFQFLEDTVTVQINYSLAAGTKSRTNTIFWQSARNAVVSGIAAALVCTVLGKAHDSLSRIVAPGAAHDMKLFPNCTLLEDAHQVANSARPYFLLYVWRFPFTFFNLVISGLLFGAKQLSLLGYIFVMGELALLLTWLWVPSSSERQDNPQLLGIAYLLQTSVVSVAAILALYLIKPLQEYTGVRFELPKPKPETLQEQFAALDAEPVRQRHGLRLSELQRELLRDGTCVLLMDLALQLSGTITFYVALNHSAPTAYQLTALGAAMPEYGLAYVISIRFLAKVVGSQLLARRRYPAFARFAKICVLATIAICCVSVGVVRTYRRAIAANYGLNACEYAGSEGCFPVYAGVFGGGDSLQDNMGVFALILAADALFNVLRGLVLSCLDFAFIGKAAVGSFVLVYVPAILIAWGTGVTVQGLYIAQNAPMLALLVSHLWRVAYNLDRMQSGEDGPWSKGVGPEQDGDGDGETDESVLSSSGEGNIQTGDSLDEASRLNEKLLSSSHG